MKVSFNWRVPVEFVDVLQELLKGEGVELSMEGKLSEELGAITTVQVCGERTMLVVEDYLWALRELRAGVRCKSYESRQKLRNRIEGLKRAMEDAEAEVEKAKALLREKRLRLTFETAVELHRDKELT